MAAVSEGENGNLLLGARALTHTSMLTGTVTNARLIEKGVRKRKLFLGMVGGKKNKKKSTENTYT